MSNDTADLLCVALFGIALVGGLAGAVIISRRCTRRNLQSLANQLGLEFFPTKSWFNYPHVAGTRRGRTVQIYVYTTGSGKTKRTWAAVSARPAGDGRLTFTFRKRNFATRLNRIFSSRPIVTGDAKFDKAWYVQTNQPDFLQVALIPELRARLMETRYAGIKGTITLDRAAVIYAENGYFGSAKCIARFLVLADVVCDLADMAEVAAQGQGKA